MCVIHLDWPDGRFRATWIPAARAPMPPTELVQGAHGCCFWQGNVVLVDNEHRGLDFPGGAREPGETPDACFRRELMEEACLRGGPCHYLGAIKIENLDDRPHGYWPEQGYLVIYAMQITEILPMRPQAETRGRRFVPPDQVPRLHESWHGIHPHMLAAALAVRDGLADRGGEER